MQLKNAVSTVKSHKGRILGYQAYYRGLGTYPELPTKQEAEAKLAEMIKFRCERESASIKVVALRGFVGVFTYGFDGGVNTRMVSPGFEGTLQSSACGRETFQEAEESFKYHVAQLTWDGSLDVPSFVPEHKHSEFLSWVQFQLRYRIAIKNGMPDSQAHNWACDNRNPYVEA